MATDAPSLRSRRNARRWRSESRAVNARSRKSKRRFVLVIGIWILTSVGFLWFNVIGCAAVLLLSVTLNRRTTAP